MGAGSTRARPDGPPRLELAARGAAHSWLAVARPRLSWRIADAPAGWTQLAAEVEVRRGDGRLESARIDGPDQVLVAWPFTSVLSRERIAVRVRIRGDDGWSDWSGAAHGEATLLEPEDWSAVWIAARGSGAPGEPAPILGTRFAFDAPVVRARLHLSALGIAEVELNGARVSEDLLVPGWTSYDRLVRFRSYDVTGLVRPGDNRLTAVLGDGWYRGRIASFPAHRGEVYGGRLALLAQLELEDAAGVRRIVGTDRTWSSGASRVLADDLYDGQTTDLRRPRVPELDGAIDVLPVSARILPAEAPPVRERERIRPVSIRTGEDGTILVDVGRDIVGWLSLRVSGTAGMRVRARHAEVLEEGRPAMRPLRTARATDEWILAGEAEELLEPRFTFHGFRFAEIQGLPPGGLVAVEAVVIGSALPATAAFSCSDPDLEQLHRNVVASAEGNFLDIPTDCPQRDERLGWTGDIQVFAPTATTLFDVDAFLGQWLESLAVDQLPDGTVPAVVPRVFREENALAGWGDAAVEVPWRLYRRYDDVEVLRRQFPSMRAWVERVQELAGEDLLWTGGPQFGDWLDPTAPPDEPGRARAHPDIVATACFSRSAYLLSRAAGVLGRTEDAARYADLAERIRGAFRAAWVRDDGRIESDSQTVYAMAIAWDLVSGGLRDRAGERLDELVHAERFRVGTGFLGTPLVLGALSATGHLDTAYRMLLNPDEPGWLYPVRMGATTIWERWDSLLPDGTVNPGEMTSFNHYAFGAVADWMHRTIGGIEVLEPGGRRIRIAPRPGGGLTRSDFSWESPYGRIRVRWRREGEGTAVEATVPPGVTAELVDPDDGSVRIVGHGEHRIGRAPVGPATGG